MNFLSTFNKLCSKLHTKTQFPVFNWLDPTKQARPFPIGVPFSLFPLGQGSRPSLRILAKSGRPCQIPRQHLLLLLVNKNKQTPNVVNRFSAFFTFRVFVTVKHFSPSLIIFNWPHCQVLEERVSNGGGVPLARRPLQQRQQCAEGCGSPRQDGLRQKRHAEWEFFSTFKMQNSKYIILLF